MRGRANHGFHAGKRLKPFFPRGMWWQVLLSNAVTWANICPRTSLAETVLLALFCWFLGSPHLCGHLSGLLQRTDLSL